MLGNIFQNSWLPYPFLLNKKEKKISLRSIDIWNGLHAVATPGILSRVFLFHFEKISGHFGLFWLFWDVSVNTGRNSRFGLKKKNLKAKTNLHSIHRKTSKGKKKKEKKINKQKYMYNKL